MSRSSEGARLGNSTDYAGQARRLVPRESTPAPVCEHRDLTAAVREVMVAKGVLNACAMAGVVGGTKVHVTISGYIPPERHFRHSESFFLADAQTRAVEWTHAALLAREGLA